MTRGQRGNKGQTKKASDTNYKEKVQDEDIPSERATTLNKSANVASRRNRERQKNGEEEASRMPEDIHDSKNADPKKDHHIKAIPQPTTEQLMIAQLIGGDTKADDPNQRSKIQKVMDITGMAEDAVATALFDAAWDEQKAIELLLEDGDHLTAWEETGSKKRKNKSKQTAEDGLKDDWDELEGYEGREKSKSRGQGRPRRGGSQSAGGGRSNFRDQTSHEREDSQGVQPQSKPGPRRGDQPSRRGGASGSSGGRGGARSFPTRQPKPEATSTDFGGFSGSIDTWNNPPAPGSGNNASNSGSGVGNPAPGSGAMGKRSARGSGGKDAFDNAGNWGDDFPQADDWDNEEYTGSLNETKVFTSRQNAAAPSQKIQPTENSTPASATLSQQQTTSQPAQATQLSQQHQSASSVVGHRNFLSNGPTPLLSQPTPFSQSIDLSTLLQKPQTQSSLASLSSQTPILNYNQQATDSLRAGLGISPSPVSGITNKGQPDLNSFSSYTSSSSVYAPTSNSFVGQGSAFTTIKPNHGQVNQPSQNGQAIMGNSLPQRSVAPAAPQPSGVKPLGPTTAVPSSANQQQRQRLPQPTKIPNSAVEMPGDSVGPLNVHFGAMEIVKFAGSSDPSMSGFDFQSNDEKYLTDKNNKPNQQNTGMYQPAKDVAKVLPSVLNSIGGNKSDGYSSNQVTSSLPKSTPAPGGIATTQFTNANRSQTGVMEIKGAQPMQQPSEPMGNYMAYSYNQNKAYHQYNVPNQFANQYGTSTYQNNSSSTGYGSQNMNYSATSTPSSGYKISSTGGDQYHQAVDSLSKFENSNASTTMSGVSLHQSVVNNPAAVLGLTSTTNALSGKVSATTAGKVANVANLPQAMIQAHQFMPPNMAPAFFGIQQPQLYAVDEYAMQRTGLHQLVGSTNNPSVPQPGGIKVPTTSFFDPNNSYGANSLPGGARNDVSANMNSLGNNSTPTTAAGPAGSTSTADKSGFGSSGVPTSSDSTSSPIPVSGHQNPQQSQQAQQQATQQAPTLGFAPASNTFQQMPPGYPAAYFYGLQYGNPAANAQSVYQPTMNVPAGAGSASSQYQKQYNYGYDALNQAGNKDFTGNYSTGSGAKATGGGSNVPGTAGHQYWGSSPLTSGQLW